MTTFVCIFLLSLGQAASAPAPELPAPVATATVIQDFMAHLEHDADANSDAIRFIQTQFEERKSGDLSGLLDESLAVLSPEFKAGLDALAAEQSEKAADTFKALADAKDAYIAVNASYFAAQADVARDDIRSAAATLLKMFERHPDFPKHTTHADHLAFLIGYAQAHMLDYERAMGTFSRFLLQYPDAPERFRTTAMQIVTELERREPGRLGDVTDLMNYAKRELHLGRTDDAVEKKQRKAVKLLDKLVEEAEQQEQQNKGGGGKGGKSKKRSRGKPQQSGSPRQQSELNSSEENKKNLDKPNIAKPGEMWGKMPPKQREQILQALQKQFPSQYRELTEQYYRQLSKDAPKP